MSALRRVPAAQATGDQPRLAMPFVEFVGLIALLMALTALSIDIMLPALPQIDATFSLAHLNDRQLVITSYFIGFAPAQLIYGTLSDRFGRRRLLFAGLLIYLAATLLAIWAPSFEALLVARALQGVGTAAPRVIAVAIVRDLFSGRQMARVMSFTMMVFITLPVIAPTIGLGLLQLGSWRLSFWLLAAVALTAMVWAAWRLPETRSSAALAAHPKLGLIEAATLALANRQSRGYAIAIGFIHGSLFGYIVSAQQIFVDVFGLNERFPLVFGAVAAVMIAALFTNARLVQRFGMRRLSHLALVGFIAASMVMMLVGLSPRPSLLAFCLPLSAAFYLFQLILPNFNAIAMQPLGRIAGMASSLIGFYTTAVATLCGWLIGQQFNGSVLPLAVGFVVLGALAMIAVLSVETRGGMFHGE